MTEYQNADGVWTHGPSKTMVELQDQLCQCNDCGRIERCTPRRDFYAKDVGQPLRCWSCAYISWGRT